MDWEKAIELVGSRQSSQDPELLEAARSLVEKIHKMGFRYTRKITAAGRTLSIHAWAKEGHMCPKTIYARIKSGWTLEDAVLTPPQNNGSKFGGKTLKQHSEDSGIALPTIYARLQRGWSIERAISEPLQVNWGGLTDE